MTTVPALKSLKRKTDPSVHKVRLQVDVRHRTFTPPPESSDRSFSRWSRLDRPPEKIQIQIQIQVLIQVLIQAQFGPFMSPNSLVTAEGCPLLASCGLTAEGFSSFVASMRLFPPRLFHITITR